MQITELLVDEAWGHFVNGNIEWYIDTIVKALIERATGFDVVVLAQASMAAAEDRCTSIDVPILSSPLLGVEAAVRMARA